MSVSDQIRNFAPLIQTLCGACVAFIAVYINQSWTTKREIAKRRLDIAEDVLATFYETGDSIRYIRMGSTGFIVEGTTRPRHADEDPQLTADLDRAYVTNVRYLARQKAFAKFSERKYKCFAVFGVDRCRKPFQMIEKVIEDLYLSANRLGNEYYPKLREIRAGGDPFATEEQREEFHRGFRRALSIVNLTHFPDIISPVVFDATAMIKKLADESADEYEKLGSSVPRWWNQLKAETNQRFPTV
jgi:hypothetical protein